MAVCSCYRTKHIKLGSSKRTMIKGNFIIYLILLSDLVNVLFQNEGFKVTLLQNTNKATTNSIRYTLLYYAGSKCLVTSMLKEQTRITDIAEMNHTICLIWQYSYLELEWKRYFSSDIIWKLRKLFFFNSISLLHWQ